MPIAGLAHQPRIAIGGWHDAAGRANDWLENECGHVFCAKAQNLFFQLPCAILSHRV